MKMIERADWEWEKTQRPLYSIIFVSVKCVLCWRACGNSVFDNIYVHYGAMQVRKTYWVWLYWISFPELPRKLPTVSGETQPSLLKCPETSPGGCFQECREDSLEKMCCGRLVFSMQAASRDTKAARKATKTKRLVDDKFLQLLLSKKKKKAAWASKTRVFLH